METPYFPLSPVTLTHTVLSFFVKKNGYRLINPKEKIGVLITVYNEGSGIKETLSAVLRQTLLPSIIVVSEHGSTDKTMQSIQDYLWAYKYNIISASSQNPCFKEIILYKNTIKPPTLLAVGKKRMSKAEGINALKNQGLLDCVDWIVTIDSDTILDAHFLEEFRNNMYKLRVSKKRLVITQNTILGAVVMPKKNGQSKFVEKFIARARTAEYSFGQILVRTGQNFTALYVAPGCGFMCKTKEYYFPNKTVTEDLELTLTVQSNSGKFRVAKQKIIELGKEFKDFEVLITHRNKQTQRMLFDQFVQLFYKRGGQEIIFRYNKAFFVKEAIMYTQEPTNLKSLANQLDRWTRGFHQVMALKSGCFRRRAGVAWTVYGAKYEGLLSSLIYLGIPLSLITYLLFGFGLKPKYFATFFLVDFVIQYCLVIIAIYKKLRIERSDKAFLKAVKESMLNMLPWYFLRAMNSVQFLKTFVGTIIDTKFKGIRDWSKNAIWERPKEIR
ncbi:MAG TPA: glycosyltransferase family 2 protein [Candidatus Paceibacterota bacterium]|nr:glycosyltransferase family 2 protein [Candidatus Paceibacterota bacterium]